MRLAGYFTISLQQEAGGPDFASIPSQKGAPSKLRLGGAFDFSIEPKPRPRGPILAEYWQSLPTLLSFISQQNPQRGANTMPTRNVNLTNELDRFVAAKVKSGRYENASEVVRAGLRTLEREERQYEAKLAALRAAIDEGDASGIAESNVFGRVRKALKLPVSS